VQPVEIYIDSDWGVDKETGRSTAGDVVFLYGNPVSWFCQKQDCVSLSTSEAEYKTQTYAFKEGMYFINLLHSEMNIQITPVQTHIDNIGADYMAEQVVTNKRTKHISLSYHYAREQVQIFKKYYLSYAGMGYSGGGVVVFLNIAAYLGRVRICVLCMSRWRQSFQHYLTCTVRKFSRRSAPGGLSILGYFCVFMPFAYLHIAGFPNPGHM